MTWYVSVLILFFGLHRASIFQVHLIQNTRKVKYKTRKKKKNVRVNKNRAQDICSLSIKNQRSKKRFVVVRELSGNECD